MLINLAYVKLQILGLETLLEHLLAQLVCLQLCQEPSAVLYVALKSLNDNMGPSSEALTNCYRVFVALVITCKVYHPANIFQQRFAIDLYCHRPIMAIFLSCQRRFLYLHLHLCDVIVQHCFDLLPFPDFCWHGFHASPAHRTQFLGRSAILAFVLEVNGHRELRIVFVALFYGIGVYAFLLEYVRVCISVDITSVDAEPTYKIIVFCIENPEVQVTTDEWALVLRHCIFDVYHHLLFFANFEGLLSPLSGNVCLDVLAFVIRVVWRGPYHLEVLAVFNLDYWFDFLSGVGWQCVYNNFGYSLQTRALDEALVG